MKPTFRKSMIWLHTYTGLLGGWLLFVIFLTGTLSYYSDEITHWMTSSELSKQSQLPLLKRSISILKKEAPTAQRWSIQLPDERGNHFVARYRNGRASESLNLDVNRIDVNDNHIIASPNTRGGDFFITFHYSLSLRDWGGRYFTGIAAMLMLIGVFTGIYTHRRFFKDFFTIRSNKKSQFLTDFHAISGIVTIPFCLVICLSALFIYINLYQPLTVSNYFDSYRALDSEVSTNYPQSQPKNEPIKGNINIDKIWPQLASLWGNDFKVSSVSISNPQDVGAQIVINRYKQENLSNKSESLAFDYLGNKLADIEQERVARTIRRIFYGLHEAHFASPILRAMLFALGLLSTLIISTGTILWVKKRQDKIDKPLYCWTDKINNACFYGLTLAIALYFFTSKSGLFANPKILELPVFFYTWLASFVLCVFMSVTQGKRILLAVNALAYWSVTLADVIGPKAKLLEAINNLDIPHITIVLLLVLSSLFFTHTLLKMLISTRFGFKKSILKREGDTNELAADRT